MFLTNLSTIERLLIAFAFVAPVLVVMFVMPTMFTDTAEAILWGRMQPMFGSHKHPPGMGWVAAPLEWLTTATAWKALVLQLLLNAVAIGYFHRISHMVLPPEKQVMLTYALCMALLFTFWPATGFSLNADVAGLPFWAGAVFHIMAARKQPKKLIHWFLAAIMLAMAIYIKYFAAVMGLALILASLAVPEFRILWRRFGPYLTIGLTCLLLLPHILWVIDHPSTLNYVHSNMQSGRNSQFNSLNVFFQSLAFFLSSFILLGLPYLTFLTLYVWRKRQAIDLQFTLLSKTPDRRFLSWFFNLMCISCFVFMLFGLNYKLRFTAPLYGFAALIWLIMLPTEQLITDYQRERIALAASSLWLLFYTVVCVLYLLISYHPVAQSPISIAAQQLKREWDARFSCGPAYSVGDWRASQLMAVYYDKNLVAVPDPEIFRVPWFDRQKARDQGAIFISRRSGTPAMPAPASPNADYGLTFEAVQRFNLPLVANLGGHKQTFLYAFAPPQNCPPK